MTYNNNRQKKQGGKKMLVYCVLVTAILLLCICFYTNMHFKKIKIKKLETLFYEDFYDRIPQFKTKDFKWFFKKNIFIVSAQNSRFDARFKDAPTEKDFLKTFKSFFPKDVNIHYTYRNLRISFIITFDCNENIICEALEKTALLYPTIFFGISQCLSRDFIYSRMEENSQKGNVIVLSSKYHSNASKASDIGHFNKKNVYRFDVSENKILPKNSLETETKILVSFNCRKIEEINRLIEEAFTESDNYSQCMYIANNFLFLLHNILTKNNCTIEEVYGDNVNLYRWTAGYKRKENIISSLQLWYSKAIVYIEEHSNKTNNIEQKIEKYIEDNYSSDISISTMAEEFGVSNQYFSRYFKSQTGSNFLDTLNKYRIKKALELLNTTNLPMSEISNITGFNNYKSFARNFKKYTGKIPSEYTKK